MRRFRNDEDIQQVLARTDTSSLQSHNLTFDSIFVAFSRIAERIDLDQLLFRTVSLVLAVLWTDRRQEAPTAREGTHTLRSTTTTTTIAQRR